MIYAYDIAEDSEIQITPIDEEHHPQHINPCVSGDYILWSDNRSGHYDIYQYYIPTDVTHRLTYGPSDETKPFVCGTHFVYVTENEEGPDIAYGSLLSFISEHIITEPHQQQNPCIAGDGPYTMVWQDNRTGPWQVYCCTESLNFDSTNCNRPYKLTEDCSFWSGATRKIEINGVRAKIAGTADGKIILLMSGSHILNSIKDGLSLGIGDTRSKPTHKCLEVVKPLLQSMDIKILKVTKLVSYGAVDGYFLELSDDGFSILKGYSQ